MKSRQEQSTIADICCLFAVTLGRGSSNEFDQIYLDYKIVLSHCEEVIG